MSELPNTIGPGFQQDIEGRLDKLEELVLAMGEVMGTKPYIDRPEHEAEITELQAGISLARRLFDELKARRAARKEADDETAT